jgi:putative flippase GtrA
MKERSRNTDTSASRARVRRWVVFYAVGAMGIVVQLAALALLVNGCGMHYLSATPLAVEAAVLHNLVWHELWTWSDRPGRSLSAKLRRFALFHLSNGMFSILGSLIAMRIFVGAAGMNLLAANALSIAVCSVGNFIASDRLVFRFAATLPIIAVFCQGAAAPAEAAQLRPETLQAWNLYVNAAEQRMAREMSSDQGFLASDFQAGAHLQRKEILAGRIPVNTMDSMDSGGKSIQVPHGMVHHWLGSIFIPGVTLQEIMCRVQNPDSRATRQEDVLASSILERGPGSLRLFLKLQRSRIVTVVYNTEHLVTYNDYGKGRAASRSIALKIREVEHPGTPEEREKPEGQDRGFLWRLNSYWRYEQVSGGVIVECESISLSRTIPSFISYFVRPLIQSVARESMNRTLSAMRERMSQTWG